MKHFEHLNFEQRKIITNQITVHKATAAHIAELLDVDPTTISKEVKRNRFLSKEASSRIKNPICEKTLRFPYVCNACPKRLHGCLCRQYRYEAKRAQKSADYRLIAPRQGINLTEEEFDILDRKIHDGLLNHQSIYHIVTSNEEISVSVPTVYNYINQGLLSTKRMDLPYAVKYKKRKKMNKKYDYSHHPVDRSNHTYIDYLAYLQKHPNVFIVQMDFLGSIQSDRNHILTLVIPNLHFVYLRLFSMPNAQKITQFFAQLESQLGLPAFQKVFPAILTDRDPCFSDMDGIECHPDTGEIRTRIFYCDAFKSSQKASVENMNKQLRKFFPKKASKDALTQEDLNQVMHIINTTRIPSLSGGTPEEAFLRVYGKTIYENLLKR